MNFLGDELKPSAGRRLRRTRLVGREPEFNAICQAWRMAKEGQRQVVFLSGEPGIGKTRLAAELADLVHKEGGGVLVGHCDEELLVSYQPFVEALRQYVRTTSDQRLGAQAGPYASDLIRLLPELALRIPDAGSLPPGDPETERYRLFEAVAAFFASIAQDRPKLLVLDDLQWAEKATLLLLRHLVQSPQQTPLLILGIYRDTDLSRSHPLADTLADLRRDKIFQRIALNGLTETEMSAFVEAWSGATPPEDFVQALHAETEGNPFFTEEVLEHLSETAQAGEITPWSRGVLAGNFAIPESIREVIGRRLSRLSVDANHVLANASVLGREFDFAVLNRLVEMDEDRLLGAIDEVTRSQLVIEQARASHPTYAFVHALIRQTLYEELNLPRRQRLHLRAANAIETVYSHNLEPHLAALATHYRTAGATADLEKTITYSVLAAEAASRVFAWEEAASHYEGALETLEFSATQADVRRCDLLLALGSALMPQGESQRVLDVIAPEALALAERDDDALRASQACRLATYALSRIGSRTITLTPLWQSWAQAYDRYAPPDSRDRIWFDTELGWHMHMTGQEARARDIWVRALSLARRLGFADELFYAAALCISFGQTPLHEHERLELAEEMFNRPIEGVSARTLAAFYLYVGWASWDWGKRAQADEAWRKLHELPGLFRDAFVTLYSLFAKGSLAALEGRLADTIAVADRLITEGDEIGSPVFGRMLAPLLSFRPRLYLGRGEEALALVPLDWQFAGAKEEPAEAKPRRLLILAHLGRRDEALRLLSEIMEARRIGPEEDGTVATSDLILLLESSVILEHRTAAAALFQRLRPLEKLIKAHGGTLTSVARHLGGAAALLGEYDEARRYYEEALQVCTRIGFRPEAALTHLQLAELLLNHFPSARSDASEHLETAIAEFGAMEMEPALDRALRLRGRRRPLPQRKAASYPDGLTEREVQVLRLLAAGKSNLQIAQELFISLHTVGHHVGNIFGKIGAGNRTEASRYAYREGLMA